MSLFFNNLFQDPDKVHTLGLVYEFLKSILITASSSLILYFLKFYVKAAGLLMLYKTFYLRENFTTEIERNVSVL